MKTKENKSNINIKGYTKIIFIILCIIIFLILVGLLIRNTCNCEGDMFSYSGAVIGGGLTLIGVIMTMLYQDIRREDNLKLKNEERKENLAIQYKPLIKITNTFVKIVSEDDKHTLSFSIENIGRGEANELEIIFNDDVEIIDCNTDDKNRYYINTFPNGEIHPIKIKYNKKLRGKEVTEVERTIEFNIYYKDLYSIYKFTTIGQILIHPKTWPHTIESINGEIEYKKIKDKAKDK